jgi:glucuronate isomerase
MTPFMTEDFLLDTEFARRLYHDYAKDQPIFDYHCHLPPQQVAENYRFKNLYDIWLKGDHYKWRAMRTNGVAERLCTGDATDREKFDAWAATVPHTIGNPLYHWTHLELRRPFGITGKLLSPTTADEIWDQCNDLLAQDNFSARGIMKQMNVKMVGTTDDPIDSLEHHAVVAKDTSLISKCCQAGARIKPSTLSRPPSTTTWRSWRKCPIPIFVVSPTCKPR